MVYMHVYVSVEGKVLILGMALSAVKLITEYT